MRAIFVDANPSLAAVTEKLLRPGDMPVAINRDPDIKAADLPRLLAGHPIAIDDHTHFPTDIVRECKDLKHVVFLGTGPRSYMNPEELAELGVEVHIIKGYGDTAAAFAAVPGAALFHGAHNRHELTFCRLGPGAGGGAA